MNKPTILKSNGVVDKTNEASHEEVLEKETPILPHQVFNKRSFKVENVNSPKIIIIGQK